MNNEELDRLFDAAFEEAAKNLPSPNPDPSWVRVEAALKQKKKRRRNKLIPYTAVAASFIMGALIFSTPTVSIAFDPLVEKVKNIQTGVVSFVFSNSADHAGKAKTNPPPVEPTEDQIISQELNQKVSYDSWEEAASNIAFPVPRIEFIPDPFKLNNVLLFSNDKEKAKKAVLFYSSGDSSFMLTIRVLEKSEMLTTGSDSSAGVYEEVEISGQKGYLFTEKSGRGSLDFLHGSLIVSISGSLTKDEFLKIAKGIN